MNIAFKPQYLTPAETAQRLRVAEATLAKWRSTGEGPAFCRVGRKIVYADDDVAAFVSRHHSTREEAAGAAGQ